MSQVRGKRSKKRKKQPDHQAEPEYIYLCDSVGHLIECEIIYIFFYWGLANSFLITRQMVARDGTP